MQHKIKKKLPPLDADSNLLVRGRAAKMNVVHSREQGKNLPCRLMEHTVNGGGSHEI